MEKLNEQAKAKHIIEINSQIARLRKKLGLNQVEFAKRAGIGLRFLRELEQGKVSVRLDKLMQVLDFLGCHLELKGNNEKMNTWLSKSGIIQTSATDI
jgi:y4mF family transcriptional regulator